MNTPADEIIQESKSSRISRPLAGAFIGIFIFLLILIPIKLLQEIPVIFTLIELDLELLGRMTLSALSMFAEIEFSEDISRILSVVVSSIPPAILGWLIGSSKKATRVAGFVLLASYLCLILVAGTLLALMAV